MTGREMYVMRRKLLLTQTKLAELTGLSQFHISLLENDALREKVIGTLLKLKQDEDSENQQSTTTAA